MIHSSKFSNDDLQKLRKVDKKYQTEFKKIFDKDFKNRDDLIKKWFTSLRDREKELIIHSYGLQGEKSKEDSVIAKIMNISEKRVKHFRGKILKILSVFTMLPDSCFDKSSSSNTRIKYDDDNENFDKKLKKYLEKEGKEKFLKEIYSQFGDLDKEIVELRIGLNNKSSKSRAEVAEWLGQSYIHVKITEQRVLNKIADAELVKKNLGFSRKRNWEFEEGEERKSNEQKVTLNLTQGPEDYKYTNNTDLGERFSYFFLGIIALGMIGFGIFSLIESNKDYKQFQRECRGIATDLEKSLNYRPNICDK